MIKKTHSQSQQTYYSTTQTNFFKAYAHQIQFINRLNELMNSIQKRKILKVVDQIKSCNKAFRKYFYERRIVHIKIQDIIAFQETYEKQNLSSSTNNFNTTISNIQEFKKSHSPILSASNGHAKQNRVSNLNKNSKFMHQKKGNIMSVQTRQMIKKGFMTLLEKLQTVKKDEFTNKTKYLESVLTRQCNKLKDYGFDEEAFTILRKNERNYNTKIGIVQEIEKQQKVNGLYPIIMKNIRDETLAVEKVQKKYENLAKS